MTCQLHRSFLPRAITTIAFIALALMSSPGSRAAQLIHRYSFTSDASDSVAGANGSLEGGATISQQAVVFNGAGAFVDLPNGIISSLTAVTFETWVTDQGSGTWARIFDFGFSSMGEGASGSGTDYLFLTPQSGSGTLRGGIKSTSAAEQMTDWPATRLPVGSQRHVVWTIDGLNQVSRIYVDGQLAGENLAVSVYPALLGYTENNWLGRSQFSADAWLLGSITEFRIYDGVLTAEEVAQNYVFGPDIAANGPVVITAGPQSQMVLEGRPVSFSVSYGGTPPVSVQWFRNNAVIPGATNDSYTIPFVPLANNGAAFKATLANFYNGTPFTASTTNAVLSVAADTVPPELLRAESLFPSEVLVTFSEAVDGVTATNPANYVITTAGGELPVIGARFGESLSNIVLTTAVQSFGTNYTLIVNNVRDISAAGKTIVPNSQAIFFASPYLGVSIGAMATNGVFNPTVTGGSITSMGKTIGGISDEFTFAYRAFTNDFDLEVRVASLSFASAWTRAGLMARSSLATNATFSACFATPGPAGCHFATRSLPGVKAAMQGCFPVNYPDTWLRLRRTNGTIEGFASLDGQTWELLGASRTPAEQVLYVGLAVTAGSASGTATAVFENAGPGSGIVGNGTPLPFEPLGPSSRRTALIISEIMYNTPDEWGGTNNLEYVELWNSGLITEDLSGHKLKGDIDYAFPENTRIAPGQFLVVAKDPAAAQAFYGVSCLGPYENKLPNNGGTVRLLNELGGALLQFTYDNKLPWPVAADGGGHSLVLNRPSYGEADPRAWSASDLIGGSPGTFERYGPEPARGILINEFLAHTDDPMQDYVELFNSAKGAVDLSGAWLSDSAGTNKFRIPEGTVMEPGGFLAFNQTTLGFSLAAEGEEIFLVNSNKTRVLDAVSFGGQANGVTMGRYPDGAPGFQELSSITQGTANAMPLIRPLVINEIMYHPISGLDEDEYIELFNRGTNAAQIGGWKLQGGITFTFPQNTIIAPGGYIVVGASRTNLITKYSQLNVTNTFGDYRGSLKDSGERIALSMPEDIVSIDALGRSTTNWCDIVVDEVSYLDGGRWGKWSDGGGSSLELIDSHSDNRFPSNWADSDESQKAEWTTLWVTNVMENGQNFADEGSAAYGVANRLEFFLQGAGEAIVDNVSFQSNGGASLVNNGDFETGMTGWSAGGVTRRSYAQPGTGVGKSHGLHVVANDRGDTGPNKVRTALKSTAATGGTNTGTLRASVRWLKGAPYVLFRIRGNWMEASQRLNVPATCGTPGLPNSQALPNAGPVIVDVSHAPILPAAGQPVVVSARVSDPDGLSRVQLRYRIDSGGVLNTVAMTNDHGIFRASIPAMASNILVGFAVTASDGAGATNAFPAPGLGAECLVRWGEVPIAGTIGTYRLWLTSSNINFWTTRERNANDPIDATFVCGNSRVIYNVDTMYSGSPFHTPDYNGPLNNIVPDYEINFKSGEFFMGAEPFVLAAYDTASGSFFFNDDSAQTDLTGTWIARKLGQQYNYRRHVHMVMNGVRRGTIYEDAQQPNSDMLDQYYPDDTGRQLRKIESWFEFADDGQTQGSVYARLNRVNASTGEIDTKRYRWNWRPRSTDDPNNWASLTNLIAVVNNTASPNYEARVRNWMDVRNYLRPVAVHHICGSWDSYAYSRGKNMYAYASDNRPWKLLMWDIEISFGATSDSPTQSIYTMTDSALFTMITSVPAFHREYLASFQEAVDTGLAPGVADAILDERYASLLQNNVNVVSPAYIKSWIAQRRSYLQSVLPVASFAITNSPTQTVSGNNAFVLGGTAPLGVDSILVNSNAYAVTWISTTTWQVIVPLAGGNNVLKVTAKDRKGNLIAGAGATVTVNYTGSTVAPEGYVLFNEIQASPASEGAGFVELYNSHASYTFDLSHWRLNGLDYTFPAGSRLAPRSYLVLAENRFKYSQAYGLTNVPFDEFNGQLDVDGETLTLLRPGTGTNEIVVDRVRYESLPPWPAATNGYSLQLIDLTQDNSRVGNWSTSATNASFSRATPGATNNIAARPPAIPGLWLNELQANNATGPTDNFGQREPWAELYNSAATNINLGGYYLSDTYTNLTKWAFSASASVTTRSHLVVWCDAEASQSTAAAPHASFRLPTGSGQLVLSRVLNGTTQVVDYLNYRNTPANWSYGDLPNGQPFYRGNMFYVTPGASNNAASAPITVFINEWMADNGSTLKDPADQGNEDWFELFNPGDLPVDLAGYFLTDTLTNKFQFKVPENGHYIVPAHGYLLVWADDEETQNSTNRVDLHANFALSKSGESIGLFAADGTQIDAVSFGPQTADVSEGRFPNGAANIVTMSLPTPRAANLLPNTPPTMEPIADRVLTLGQTLSFTVRATDSDEPAQALVYTLGNAPSGASIGYYSGNFTWKPVSAGVSLITVTANDDGFPTRSASRTFGVSVVPAPALGGFIYKGAHVTFNWATVAGQRYQVERKSILDDTEWTAASNGAFVGTGDMMSFTNVVDGSAPQQYFRVRLLP